jgi:pyruvate,water dikinase
MIHWLEEVDESDRRTVGQKAATLGELMDGSYSVPRGFLIEADFFETLLADNDLRERIASELDGLDTSDRTDLQRASERIQSWIDDITIPDSRIEEIEEAYEQINLDHKVRNAGEKAVELVGGQRETPFVAVRGHDTSGTDGIYDTYLGINGKDAVVSRIQEAWKSYYSPLALKRRAEGNGAGSFTVMVQSMAEPEVSGTVFTRDPFNGDDEIVVESVYGIGSSLTDGTAVPDRFRVDRETGRLSDRDIATKEWKIERDPATGSTVKHRVPDSRQDERSLSSDQLSEVVNTALEIDRRHDRPVRVDVSIGRNKTYILDVTGIERAQDTDEETDTDSLLEGVRAAPGTGSGRLAVVYEDNDITGIEDGSVVASINASPALGLLSGDVAAIVTEKGGIASSLASIARQDGIPLLVGCRDATDILEAGKEVTVDCTTGTVQEGQARTTASDGPEIAPAEDKRGETETSAAITATGILTVNETVDGADGTVAMRYSDVRDPDWVLEAGSPDRRIHQQMKESFQGGGFLVEDYADVLRLAEARERDATHVFLDITSLQQQGSDAAVQRAIEEAVAATDGTACSLILDEPDESLIMTAVEAGVDNVVVPPDRFGAFQQHIERAERGFILDRLRDM